MNLAPFIRCGAALIVLGSVGTSSVAEQPSLSKSPVEVQRVVSMNPSLTRMLIALGARDRLVGVDHYSAITEPSVGELPKVGGLFNPSLEQVVALEPDLVVVVPSIQQRDFRSRLGELGVEVLELSNITLDEILQSIETLGDRIGRSEAAQQRVAAIRNAWSETAKQSEQRTRRSAVLVITRDPLYVAGGGSYLNSMLEAAGVDNAAAKYKEAYPRVSLEWLIATKPQVIIDSADDPISAQEHWSRWPSIPAVADGRVVAVQEGVVTLPGPYLDRSLQTLAAAIRRVDAPSDVGETGVAR
jgi:iron complex transport system substrate-binding protein